MRTLLVTIVLLAQLVFGKVLPVEPPLNFTSSDFFELSGVARRSLFARQNTPPPEGDPKWEDPYEKLWNDALCRGERLLHVMTLGELDAAWALGWPYLHSLWDGDLKNELKTWGWLDTDDNHKNSDYFCNFEEEMGNMFKGLNIDGRSAEMGGPNHCFYIEHKNGPTVKKNSDSSLSAEVDQKYDVQSKGYRVTGAYSRVGINRQDGVIYFLHRRSPEKGAAILWELPEDTNLDPSALPKLRSSSDLAFGLWNRVAAPNGQKIEKFLSINIVNEDAEEIIRRALETFDVDDVHGWPRTDFDTTTDAGKALLGSPNGLGAAYFLLQHHKQLGSAKSINKVKLVTCEDDGGDPCLVFYVGPVLTDSKKRRAWFW
ncbi:Mitochondrial import inner membrane translocase subunit tim8 [Didymella sp. IMI 355093]|nr:Mitochondrial import inner membrane translocase subunit tim8 [Didymella sp. IMI 355093]